MADAGSTNPVLFEKALTRIRAFSFPVVIVLVVAPGEKSQICENLADGADLHPSLRFEAKEFTSTNTADIGDVPIRLPVPPQPTDYSGISSG